MISFDLRAGLRELTTGLNAFQRTQVPFAASLALTALAKKAAAAEAAELPKVFAGPTPFTGKAFGVIPARKATLTATLFVKDIQAAYLAPYIDGGSQSLGGKKAILTPRDLALNTYGNIPKGKLASLKGRPGVFIGEVTTKSGAVIGGVWQRMGAAPKGSRIRGRRGAMRAPNTGRLRLLIQFTRPAEVTHRFAYEAVARRAIDGSLASVWEGAFARAMATAR